MNNNAKPTFVDDYLQSLESPQKEELSRVNAIIIATVPDAQQVLTYGMPGYKLDGKYLIAFASFNNHMSIFPGAAAVEKFRTKLAGFTTSKGTIQFTVENPLPKLLIEEIIKERVVDIRSA